VARYLSLSFQPTKDSFLVLGCGSPLILYDIYYVFHVNYLLNAGTYNIKIGNGGLGGSITTENGETGKNTSISLGNHFEQFINNEIESGRYASVSEVIRTALRLLESEEKKINEIRKALVVGEESGWVKDFNPEDQLKALHKKYK
jgi:antitoxin ParD1/3/4